jgi:hypothetical protein
MSITTALAAQKTQFETDAAALTDTRLQLEASVLIERWHAAATALATLEAQSIDSYSLSGRNIQRRRITDASETVARLRGEIESALFGGSTILADHRSGYDGERQ